MDQKIDITENNITIEVDNKNYLHDNYRTVLFQARGISRDIVSNIEINISDENYKYLGEKLYPDGLLPESFDEKLALLNYLIEELGLIYDFEDKGWYISKVRHDKDEDKLYAYFEED